MLNIILKVGSKCLLQIIVYTKCFYHKKIIRIVDTLFIMFMGQISLLNSYFIIDDMI